MADTNKLLDDATANALLTAGKHAAERAARDLLSTDEERAARQAEEARATKKRRWKLVAMGVLGLCVVIGVIGMLLSYWHWFLLLGLAGIASLLGWRWLGRRMAARKERAAKRIAPPSSELAQKAIAAPPEARKATDALAEAELSEEEVEEELAALKARVQQRRGG